MNNERIQKHSPPFRNNESPEDLRKRIAKGHQLRNQLMIEFDCNTMEELKEKAKQLYRLATED